MFEGLFAEDTALSYTNPDNYVYYNSYDETTGNYSIATNNSSPEAKIGTPGAYYSTIYTYYDKDDNEISRYICHDQNKWSRWTDSEWITCTGTITLNTNYGPRTIELDNQGRMLIDNSTHPELGVCRYEYYYTDNGYGYTMSVKDGDEYKPFRQYAWIFKDNVLTQINEYLTDATGNKTVSDYNTHISTSYSKAGDGEWVETYKGGLQHKEIMPNGIDYLTIGYMYDQSENASVARDKEIRNLPNDCGYEYTERYSWDQNSNEWIGQSKSMSRTDLSSQFDFAYYNPTDPCEFSDEYFVPLQSSDELSSYSCKNYQNASYYWDYATKDWRLSQQVRSMVELTESGGGKQLKESVVETGSDGVVTITETITDVNNDGMLTGSQKLKNRVLESTRKLTYNEKGQLTEDMNESSSAKFVHTYTYADIELTGIEDVIADTAEGVLVNGRQITATAGFDAEVYNISGAAVARIPAGTTATLPEVGIYIIRTGSAATKIVVK